MVSIIGGSDSTSCGISASSLSMFSTRPPGCHRSQRCRRRCRTPTAAPSRSGCRSSAAPSRSSCGSAGRSRRNPRCDHATRRCRGHLLGLDQVVGDVVDLLHQAQHSFQVSIMPWMSSACFNMSAMRSWLYFSFIFWVVPCMLIMNGIEVCSMGVPCGRVIACTREIPGPGRWLWRSCR